MKILAVDTATERCSAALLVDGRMIERAEETPRGHADLILPMVESVLQSGRVRLQDLDGLAYGRGPGAFTGVRIAVSVAQGLAFGANLLTVGVSDLAAVARQVAGRSTTRGQSILVCMDARMGEVYWGRFKSIDDGIVADSGEKVSSPEAVIVGDSTILAGTGFRAYPHLAAAQRHGVVMHDSVLPQAREVALLAEIELRAGRGRPAAQAAPVYLRDQVTFVKSP